MEAGLLHLSGVILVRKMACNRVGNDTKYLVIHLDMNWSAVPPISGNCLVVSMSNYCHTEKHRKQERAFG